MQRDQVFFSPSGELRPRIVGVEVAGGRKLNILQQPIQIVQCLPRPQLKFHAQERASLEELLLSQMDHVGIADNLLQQVLRRLRNFRRPDTCENLVESGLRIITRPKEMYRDVAAPLFMPFHHVEVPYVVKPGGNKRNFQLRLAEARSFTDFLCSRDGLLGMRKIVVDRPPGKLLREQR